MMELNKNLQTLIQRTWELQDKINERIHYDTISFCKQCLEHGLCCGISETTVEERKRLIAIRDSLKDVLDILVFLQKSESSRQKHENAALSRLEASRLLLVEKINQYPGGQGKKFDLLEELNAWFGDGETAFICKLKANKKQKIMRRTANISSVVMNCIRGIFDPWNWYKNTRFAIKLMVISIAISSSVEIGRSRLQREILSSKNPKIAGKLGFTNDSNSHIDVTHGRG